jgi:prolyl-tRNA synthetase
MRMSELYAPTLREIPAEAEIVSHRLMLRAGMMRKLVSGVYSYLPLANRVIQKIEKIVREEMNAKGGQEVLMPALQPASLWQETGRWWDFGPEMFKLTDRQGREFCLGPTHEELFTNLIRNEVRSYKQLPLLLYQIQTKFRDEIRPRFGLMRACEFIMKDLYSFDVDEEGLDVSYKKMYDAYSRAFKRCGLDCFVVEADTGSMGGTDSHEFMVPSDIGEDEIAICIKCGYAANIEKCACVGEEDNEQSDTEEPEELREVATPDIKTIDELSGFLKASPEKMIKTLIYETEDGVLAVLVRGDHEINEAKLKKVLGGAFVQLAEPDTIQRVTGAPVGFAGPVGLKDIKILADYSVKNITNGITGANKKDAHFTGVNIGRDYNVQDFHDLRFVKQGDPCPRCMESLNIRRGIEVGHIFKLGTKYSKALGATYLNKNGEECPIIMGSYGIGITRTLAAIIETNHDEAGIKWPFSVAPYHVIIVNVNTKNQELVELCEKLYKEFQDKGVEVLYDDRDERPGVKFNDSDLIGIPIRVTIGPRGLKEGVVEVKMRRTSEEFNVPVAGVVDALKGVLDKEKVY